MSTAVQRIPAPSVPSDSQLAVAYAVCRDITKTAAKNFYYAFLVLPAPKRQALYAVYAFMRRCDDIADDGGFTAHERRLKLGAWVEAFHQSQAGKPTDDPVQLALADAVRRFQIPPVLLDQLAYGTAMDIEDRGPERARGSSAISGSPRASWKRLPPRRSSNTRPLTICIYIVTGSPRWWGWCAFASSDIVIRRLKRWRSDAD